MMKQYKVTLDVQERAWDTIYRIAREVFDEAEDYTIAPGDGDERLNISFILAFDGGHVEAHNFVVEHIQEGCEARSIENKDIFVSVADVDTGAIYLKHIM